MKVFVSSQAVDYEVPASLIRGLREVGVEVEHSPRNPMHGADARWPSWYESGLAAAMAGCDAFVAVIDHAWDSSTWMAIEAGVVADNVPASLFFWNPMNITVGAAGMKRFLGNELPGPVGDATSALVGGAG